MAISAALMRRFQDYDTYHRTRGNKLCHVIGVPMITVTTIGLLARVTILGFDLGVLATAFVTLRYFFWDWRIAAPFALFLTGLYWLAKALSLPALVLLFVLGWIIQFLGHGIWEKKSPAFFQNAQHLLIGPLWVFARWVGYYR